MVPQSRERKKKNSSKVNLTISAVFHVLLVGVLLYFAAREGLLGKKIQKISVQMVKEKQPEKGKPKITRIEVAASGTVTLNGATVTIAELRNKLSALKEENPDMPVVVKGADEVEFQGMVNVLDTLQQLNITKVGLATQQGGQ